MPYVPPWLNVTPDYFLNAIRAGSQAGTEVAANALRARQMSLQAQEAAGRLGLGYAEAAQRVATVGAEMQMRREMAAAQLREAQERQASLELYRQQLEENRRRDDERALAQMALQERGVETGEEREKRMALESEAKTTDPRLIHAGRDVLLYDPTSGQATPIYRGAVGGAAGKLAEALGLSQTGTGGALPGALPTRTATPGVPGFAEGQRVRSKSTNRMGTIVNGQVQWDEQPELPPAPQAPSIFQGMPGALPTPGGGSMYAGELTPELSDIGAR